LGYFIVGTQQPSRYTFHPIFPRWLGSGLSFYKEFPRIHPITDIFLNFKELFIFTQNNIEYPKKIYYHNNMHEYIAEIFGIIMTISFMFCYIPQILKIFKNRSSKDVSLALILMSICGYISGMVYMFLTQFGVWWFANYSVGLVMCIILVYAWFKFQKGVR
jgi:uncharacterized protein with PQ loop repeat